MPDLPASGGFLSTERLLAGRRRWLANVGVVIGIGLVVLVSSLAIGAPATTMTEHGVSVDDFQFAGTSANAEQAYGDLGQDGRRAAWWFLGFELPFLAGFGLLLCAGCAFAARQLIAAGAERLARVAGYAVAFGLLAALSDLIQNSALAVVLTGHFGQPAPRLAEVFGYLTWVFGISAGFVFVAGWLVAALRSRRAAARLGP
jgi:ABC-type antimicrobial peptide transport system permease subunit